ERPTRLRLRGHGFCKTEGVLPAAAHAALLCASFMERVATVRLRRLRGVKLRLAVLSLFTIAAHLRGTHSFTACSYRGAAAVAAAGGGGVGGRLHPAAAGSVAGGGRCSSYLARDVRWRSATKASSTKPRWETTLSCVVEARSSSGREEGKTGQEPRA
ncbi:unnamed protein product, partial [Laminaria digitata]